MKYTVENVISVKDTKENVDFIKDYIGKKCFTKGTNLISSANSGVEPDSIIVGADDKGFIETKYIRHKNFPVRFYHSYVVVA